MDVTQGLGMNVTRSIPMGLTPPHGVWPGGAREGGGGFGVPGFEAGAASVSRGGGGAGDVPREAAKDLVSIALILPLLKMARNDPLKSELFHGGPGEDAFGGQLDEHLAGSITEGMNPPIVEAVYDQLTGAGAANKRIDRHG